MFARQKYRGNYNFKPEKPDLVGNALETRDMIETGDSICISNNEGDMLEPTLKVYGGVWNYFRTLWIQRISGKYMVIYTGSSPILAYEYDTFEEMMAEDALINKYGFDLTALIVNYKG